jgi:hypothetical protein
VGGGKRSEERSGDEWIVGLLVVIRVFLSPLSASLRCCCAQRWCRRGVKRCGTGSRLHYSQKKNGGVGDRNRLLKSRVCIHYSHDAFRLERAFIR